ncbi:unnamed protein product [Chrysoparadoxa australica]
MRGKCRSDGCEIYANYGTPGRTAEFCASHKDSGMERTGGYKKCAGEGCTKHPWYGHEGGSPTYCHEHKEDGMVYLIKRTTCKDESCPKLPSYGFESGSSTHCAQHKEPGMVYLRKQAKCLEKTCAKHPSCGRAGTKPSHCAQHKEEGMFNWNSRCSKKGCTRSVRFGPEGGSKPIVCLQHKTPSASYDFRKKQNRQVPEPGPGPGPTHHTQSAQTLMMLQQQTQPLLHMQNFQQLLQPQQPFLASHIPDTGADFIGPGSAVGTGAGAGAGVAAAASGGEHMGAHHAHPNRLPPPQQYMAGQPSPSKDLQYAPHAHPSQPRTPPPMPMQTGLLLQKSQHSQAFTLAAAPRDPGRGTLAAQSSHPLQQRPVTAAAAAPTAPAVVPVVAAQRDDTNAPKPPGMQNRIEARAKTQQKQLQKVVPNATQPREEKPEYPRYHGEGGRPVGGAGAGAAPVVAGPEGEHLDDRTESEPCTIS